MKKGCTIPKMNVGDLYYYYPYIDQQHKGYMIQVLELNLIDT